MRPTIPLAFALSAPLLLAAGASAQSASNLWKNNCQSCHGATGAGGGAGTRTLLTDEKFDQRFNRAFFDAIKKGVPESGMAAFGETLTDQQIWSLVVHIRELQRDERMDRLGRPKPGERGVYTSQRERYRVETVIGREMRIGSTPWAVAPLPDGRLLITERSGKLLVFTPGKDGAKGTLSAPVEGTPEVRNQGQGGLMEVALHPDFATSGWVYLSFTNPMDGGQKGMTKVVRGKLAGLDEGKPRWTEQATIFECRPEHYLTGPIHFGCKIVFDPPAYATANAPKDKPAKRVMYFALGERGRGELAQDLGRPNGKLYRVYDDGSIPEDNPFKDSPYPQIWSYGHRNEQGLAIDLEGRLWETEHGPRGGDELNLIMKGRNYGWPVVSFGINYSDAPLATPWPQKPVSPAGKGPDDGFVMPAYTWVPSIAASGLDVVRGDAFPNWRGDLLAGGLAGETVQRLRMRVDPATGAAEPVEREEIIGGMGRVRDVRVAPDGTIYVVLNDPGRVLRVVPVRDAKPEGAGKAEGAPKP